MARLLFFLDETFHCFLRSCAISWQLDLSAASCPFEVPICLTTFTICAQLKFPRFLSHPIPRRTAAPFSPRSLPLTDSKDGQRGGRPSSKSGSALSFFFLFSNSPNVDCPPSFLGELSRNNGAPRLVPERSQQPSLHQPIGQQCHKWQLRDLSDGNRAAQALEVLWSVGLKTKRQSGKGSKQVLLTFQDTRS